MFQLNGNFLVICWHLDLTHSSFSSSHMHYAQFHAYMHVHGCMWPSTHLYKCIHVFLAYSGYSKLRKEHVGHEVAADCSGNAIFSLSVLSRCLPFDILKSQDIIASRADKRAVFTVHLTSLFKRQIDFFVMQTSVPVGTKPTLTKLFFPDYREAIRW